MASALKWLAFAICVAGLYGGRSSGPTRTSGATATWPTSCRPTGGPPTSGSTVPNAGVARRVAGGLRERQACPDLGARHRGRSRPRPAAGSAWAAITGKRATLVDVARLNTILNTSAWWPWRGCCSRCGPGSRRSCCWRWARPSSWAGWAPAALGVHRHGEPGRHPAAGDPDACGGAGSAAGSWRRGGALVRESIGKGLPGRHRSLILRAAPPRRVAPSRAMEMACLHGPRGGNIY